jgi:negative regulator of sigma E activity
MSPHLHRRTVADHETAIPGAIPAHHPAAADLLRRALRSHLGQVVAALSICLAIATAVILTSAPASSHATQASGQISALQMNREIRAFQSMGYTPVACTRQGTLMRNSQTGRLVTAK